MHKPKGLQAILAERRAKTLRLISRGRRFDDIVRISHEEDWPRPYNNKQAVSKDVARALEEATAERNMAAKSVIERELQKLDEMEAETWKVAESLHFVVNQGEVVYLEPEEIRKLKTKRGWHSPKLDPETIRALEAASKDGKPLREPLLDNKPILECMGVLLKIAERRAKLQGLDAPVKKQVEVTGTEGIQSEIHGIVDVFKAALGIGAELDDDSPDEGEPEPGRASSG